MRGGAWVNRIACLITSTLSFMLVDSNQPNAAGSGLPALPKTSTCPADHSLVKLSERSDWLPSEIWAWEKICIGEVANLAERLPAPATCPAAPQHKSEILLSERFLRTILAYEPFSKLITPEGILIECAIFDEQLKLSELRTQHRLWIEKSRFLQGVEAVNFKIDNELSFHGSQFDGSLILDRAKINGSLWLNKTKFDGPVLRQCESTPDPCAVQAIGLETSSDLVLSESELAGHLNLGGVKAAGGLSLRSGRYRQINLNGAVVGGDLRTCNDPYACSSGSRIEHLSLDAATIRGSVLLNGSNFYGGGTGIDADVSLDFTRARIENQLELMDVYLAGIVKANSLFVGGDALLRGKSSFGSARFLGSTFEGSLDLRGITVRELFDLSNARIRNSLIFHAPGSRFGPPNWTMPASRLSLQNTRTESLQDWGAGDTRFIYDALKGKLELNNFVYAQFGLVDSSVANLGIDFDVAGPSGPERVARWLAMQTGYDRFPLPQPFQQLARALENAGDADEARLVRISARDHALFATETPLADKILLFFQRIFIGYGYNTWLSLIWLGALVTIGAVVIAKTPSGSLMSWDARVWLSLDLALPIIELDKKHDQFDQSGARQYFYAHRIVGFVLASFLVAGLSGLTK